LPALMSLEADSRYSKMMVQLKPVPEAKLPSKEQLVLLADDGEGVTSITLRGAAAIESGALSASLNLRGANRQPIVLYPTTLAVARSGTEIQLSFPSLKVLGFAASDLVDEPLQLKYAATHSPAQQEAYRVRPLADGAKPAPNPVSTTSSVIVADDAGMAKLMLRIGKVDANNLPVLAVSGADVRETAPAGIASVSPRGVSVHSTGIVTVTLANLTPAQPVTIRTIDGAKGTEIGNSIRLGVERSVGVR
jgi:hypothetical protein